jgi:hypothetical protein
MAKTNRDTDGVEQRLLRRRDVARILGVSESLCPVLERRGLLVPLRPESIGRVVRYDATAVQALADRLIAETKAG